MKNKHFLFTLSLLISAMGCNAQLPPKTLFVNFIKGLQEIHWSNGDKITGVLKDSTFAGATHNKVPTSKAVKDYVDSQLTTGAADGNGIYSGSDTIPDGTVALYLGLPFPVKLAFIDTIQDVTGGKPFSGFHAGTADTYQVDFGFYDHAGDPAFVAGGASVLGNPARMKLSSDGIEIRSDVNTPVSSSVSTSWATDFVIKAKGAANMVVFDSSSTKRGLEYAADYGSSMVERSLPDIAKVRKIVGDSVVPDQSLGRGFVNGGGSDGSIPDGTVENLSGSWEINPGFSGFTSKFLKNSGYGDYGNFLGFYQSDDNYFGSAQNGTLDGEFSIIGNWSNGSDLLVNLNASYNGLSFRSNGSDGASAFNTSNGLFFFNQQDPINGDATNMTFASGVATISGYSGAHPFRGLLYADDYSSAFTDHSLVDKAYVDGIAGGSLGTGFTGGGGSGTIPAGTSVNLENDLHFEIPEGGGFAIEYPPGVHYPSISINPGGIGFGGIGEPGHNFSYFLDFGNDQQQFDSPSSFWYQNGAGSGIIAKDGYEFKLQYADETDALRVSDVDNSIEFHDKFQTQRIQIGNGALTIQGGNGVQMYAYDGGISIQEYGSDPVSIGGPNNSNPQLYLFEPSGGNASIFTTQSQSIDVTYVLPASGPSDRQVLTEDTLLGGKTYLKWAAPSGGGGSTNLTISGTSSPITINSSTGADVTATAGSGISITSASSTNFTITNTGDTNASDDITTSTSAAGDVSGTFPTLTVAKIQGRTVASTAPTSNQVIKWNSGSSQWEPATDATGSVATDAIWDTKGDISVATGADAAVKLPVGSDGQQIYADASQTAGLRWGPVIISPSQLTADQDNFSPTNWAKARFVRLDADTGFRAITSFAATYDGDLKTIINTSGNCVYIPGEHPDGTAANRAAVTHDYILYGGHSADIFYDGTSARWRILTPQESPIGKPALSYSWSAGSATTGDYGNFSFTSTGTGASFATQSPGSGILASGNMDTGTTSTGGTTAYFTKGTTDAALFGSAHMAANFLTTFLTASDATNDFTLYYAIDDASSTIALNNNSVGIRYNYNVNGGKWQGFSRDNAGSETTVDLGVTASTSTTYNLRVEIDKARSEARFYIDGVMRGRVTGNMPNAVGAGAHATILKSVGTASRAVRLHSMSMEAIQQ